MVLIWSVFVIVWLLRRPLARILSPLPAFTALIILFLFSGLITEVLAWGSTVWRGGDTPVVFHPQLGVDLTIAIGFYGGLGLGWALLARFFRFTLIETVLCAGIYGILVEQDGMVLLQILQTLPRNLPLALLLGAYVFLVYGAFTGIAFAPLAPIQGRRSHHWVRFVLVLPVSYVMANLGVISVLAIWELFGGLPDARSALTHPIW